MEEPFPEWVETAMGLGLLLSLIVPAVILLVNNGRAESHVRAFLNEDDWDLDVNDIGEPRMRARSGRPTIVRESLIEHRNQHGTSLERLWRVEVGGLQLGARTSLAIGLDGLGAIRNRESIRDVIVGDASFDRRFKVGGSDEDVVRGVFAQEEAKAAVVALFDAMTVRRCVLEGDTLEVDLQANHLRRRTAVQRVALIRRFADVLDAASVSLALPEAARTHGSAGTPSGSPVGVRIL